jgi:transposase
VLKTPCAYSHLSVISAITQEGRLYFASQERAYTSEDVVEFLKELKRKIGGKLLIIWDGAPIHRGEPIKKYLREGAAKFLHLERLPGYAPELNPDEGIWQYLKRVELANTVSKTLAELSLRLGEAIRRVRRKQYVVKGCIAQAGFSL